MSLRFDARYWVVFGGCLTQFTVIGMLFAYGLFFNVLESEFGWSRAMLSGSLSSAFLVMGVLAVINGRLSDRFGPGWVLGIAGTLYGIGFVLLANITEIWQLYLCYTVFIGIGMSSHDVVTLSTVARWFDKRRGIMTGVVKVGTAVGQIVVPLVAAYLILTFGWRSALTFLGIAAGLLLLIAASCMKKPPPLGPAAMQPLAQNATFAQARRTRLFWTLCAIQFLFFPSLVTIPLHIVVHGIDLGMTTTTAAALVSVIGACSVAGRLVVGGLLDRIGGKYAMIVCLVPLISSISGFLWVDTASMLFAAVTLYGFAHGGLFTVVSPTVAQYFGTRTHGMLFGIVVFFGTLGGAFGPILAGWIFDHFGAYMYAFGTLAAMAAIALLLAISLPRHARTFSAE